MVPRHANQAFLAVCDCTGMKSIASVARLSLFAAEPLFSNKHDQLCD